MCLWMSMCTCGCRYPRMPEEGISFLRAGVADSCVPPDVDAGI